MKKKILLLFIIINIFMPCYAIDIQAIKTNTACGEIDLDALRKTLKENNCIMEF